MARIYRCHKNGCAEVISEHKFACLAHWHMLSTPVQRAIIETRHQHVLMPARRAALAAARADWRD